GASTPRRSLWRLMMLAVGPLILVPALARLTWWPLRAVPDGPPLYWTHSERLQLTGEAADVELVRGWIASHQDVGNVRVERTRHSLSVRYRSRSEKPLVLPRYLEARLGRHDSSTHVVGLTHAAASDVTFRF